MEIISGILIISGLLGFVIAGSTFVVSLVSSVLEAFGWSTFKKISERRIFDQRKKMFLFAVMSFLIMGLGVELLP